MNSTDDFILFVLSYVPPNSKKQYQTFCQSSHEILGYHTIIRLFFVFCSLYWYCTLTYSFCFKGQVKTIYNVNLRCIPMIILLGNILQSLKQIKQLIDVASMCCKSRIKMRRRRVVVPYLPHNTRGGYLPLSLPQVTVCVQDKLPVGSLPETSCAIVFRIISDISPIFYTQLQNIWVKAYLGKPWSCSQTVFFLTAFIFYLLGHAASVSASTPFWQGLIWWPYSSDWSVGSRLQSSHLWDRGINIALIS